MRIRSLIIILTLCMAIALLSLSCNAEVSHSSEELVSVSFGKDTARALSANLPSFNVDSYYWYYAAEKVDDSLLCSGETDSFDESGAVAVNGGNKGLAIVRGFSQGIWNFRLFAYKGTGKTDLVYEGLSTGVALKSSSTNETSANVVKVVVSPISDSTKSGTLSIDIESIRSSSSVGTVKKVYIAYVSMDSWTGSFDSYSEVTGSSYSVELAPGAYSVSVKLETDDKTATGAVVATVYSNLETSIGGSITGTVSSGT